MTKYSDIDIDVHKPGNRPLVKFYAAYDPDTDEDIYAVYGYADLLVATVTARHPVIDDDIPLAPVSRLPRQVRRALLGEGSFFADDPAPASPKAEKPGVKFERVRPGDRFDFLKLSDYGIGAYALSKKEPSRFLGTIPVPHADRPQIPRGSEAFADAVFSAKLPRKYRRALREAFSNYVL